MVQEVEDRKEMTRTYERRKTTKQELFELYQEDIAILRDELKRPHTKEFKKAINKLIYLLILNSNRLSNRSLGDM